MKSLWGDKKLKATKKNPRQKDSKETIFASAQFSAELGFLPSSV